MLASCRTAQCAAAGAASSLLRHLTLADERGLPQSTRPDALLAGLQDYAIRRFRDSPSAKEMTSIPLHLQLRMQYDNIRDKDGGESVAGSGGSRRRQSNAVPTNAVGQAQLASLSAYSFEKVLRLAISRGDIEGARSMGSQWLDSNTTFPSGFTSDFIDCALITRLVFLFSIYPSPAEAENQCVKLLQRRVLPALQTLPPSATCGASLEATIDFLISVCAHAVLDALRPQFTAWDRAGEASKAAKLADFHRSLKRARGRFASIVDRAFGRSQRADRGATIFNKVFASVMRHGNRGAYLVWSALEPEVLSPREATKPLRPLPLLAYMWLLQACADTPVVAESSLLQVPPSLSSRFLDFASKLSGDEEALEKHPIRWNTLLTSPLPESDEICSAAINVFRSYARGVTVLSTHTPGAEVCHVGEEFQESTDRQPSIAVLMKLATILAAHSYMPLVECLANDVVPFASPSVAMQCSKLITSCIARGGGKGRCFQLLMEHRQHLSALMPGTQHIRVFTALLRDQEVEHDERGCRVPVWWRYFTEQQLFISRWGAAPGGEPQTASSAAKASNTSVPTHEREEGKEAEQLLLAEARAVVTLSFLQYIADSAAACDPYLQTPAAHTSITHLIDKFSSLVDLNGVSSTYDEQQHDAAAVRRSVFTGAKTLLWRFFSLRRESCGGGGPAKEFARNALPNGGEVGIAPPVEELDQRLLCLSPSTVGGKSLLSASERSHLIRALVHFNDPLALTSLIGVRQRVLATGTETVFSCEEVVGSSACISRVWPVIDSLAYFAIAHRMTRASGRGGSDTLFWTAYHRQKQEPLLLPKWMTNESKATAVITAVACEILEEVAVAAGPSLARSLGRSPWTSELLRLFRASSNNTAAAHGKYNAESPSTMKRVIFPSLQVTSPGAPSPSAYGFASRKGAQKDQGGRTLAVRATVVGTKPLRGALAKPTSSTKGSASAASMVLSGTLEGFDDESFTTE